MIKKYTILFLLYFYFNNFYAFIDSNEAVNILDFSNEINLLIINNILNNKSLKLFIRSLKDLENLRLVNKYFNCIIDKNIESIIEKLVYYSNDKLFLKIICDEIVNFDSKKFISLILRVLDKLFIDLNKVYILDKKKVLYYAIYSNNIKLLKILKSFNKINFNEFDINLNKPLIYSCFRNSFDSVDYLLKNGVDINTKDLSGYSALIHCVIKKNYEMVLLLLKNNADINIQDDRGYTPLIWAIIKEDEKMVKILLDNWADINIETYDKTNAYKWALYSKNKNILNLLLTESYKRTDEYFNYRNNCCVIT